MKTLKDNRNLEKTHQLGRLIFFRALRSRKWIWEITVNKWIYSWTSLLKKLHVLSFTLKTDLFATEHPHFPRTLPSHNHAEFLIPNTVDWFGFFLKSQLVVRAKWDSFVSCVNIRDLVICSQDNMLMSSSSTFCEFFLYLDIN